MNQKELKELIEFLIEKDIAEFELERGDVKVRVKRAGEQTVVSAPPHMAFTHHAPAPPPEAVASPAPLTTTQKAAAMADEGLHIVKSPIVGTYYESPSPGSPPFVKVGDSVEAGEALCIIEAMKLMNEIESDVAGEVVKKLAANGQPVEYGQPLFAIRQK
ncbi:MAG: acetyl-CoA carboxylase biotin carboxyl carrier protein [Candidatus Koribacter versatilis]|uniref:Biotin carboxyl carrier protein of acetyl-CoA carboxylase n=1 Tax=Candidatus Korobacter versatilis TaxID=658062 RepID=A0A932A8C0_9BACT|nr:acetyl-CoA carboxylase biotin carboxyl carrier protein [Candidatus Koribacter versatilis]